MEEFSNLFFQAEQTVHPFDLPYNNKDFLKKRKREYYLDHSSNIHYYEDDLNPAFVLKRSSFLFLRNFIQFKKSVINLKMMKKYNLDDFEYAGRLVCNNLYLFDQLFQCLFFFKKAMKEEKKEKKEIRRRLYMIVDLLLPSSSSSLVSVSVSVKDNLFMFPLKSHLTLEMIKSDFMYCHDEFFRISEDSEEEIDTSSDSENKIVLESPNSIDSFKILFHG